MSDHLRLVWDLVFNYFSKVIIHNIQDFSVVRNYFAFSVSMVKFVFKPFSKKKTLQFSKTFLVGYIFDIQITEFLSLSLFVLYNRLTQTIICFLHLLLLVSDLVSDLVSFKLLLSLDLVTVAFLRHFMIKNDLWLKLAVFFWIGTE